MSTVKTNIKSSSTIVLGINTTNFNAYTALALFAALFFRLGNSITSLFSIGMMPLGNPELRNVTNQVTADEVLNDTNQEIQGVTVTNLNALVEFCLGWISNPAVNLIIRLAASKSVVNLTQVWDDFKGQGYNSYERMLAFFAHVQFLVKGYTSALSSKLVLDYVSNVTMREFKNGVLMLTIKAPGVTFTNVQMWAIEYLLINKHGLENNRPLIITFETVTITGLTSFFGNDEVLAKFNLEVVTQFNNAEKGYTTDTAQNWVERGSVVYINATDIPTDERSTVLNAIIEEAMSNIGEFPVVNKTIVA